MCNLFSVCSSIHSWKRYVIIRNSDLKYEGFKSFHVLQIISFKSVTFSGLLFSKWLFINPYTFSIGFGKFVGQGETFQFLSSNHFFVEAEVRGNTIMLKNESYWYNFLKLHSVASGIPWYFWLSKALLNVTNLDFQQLSKSQDLIQIFSEPIFCFLPKKLKTSFV